MKQLIDRHWPGIVILLSSLAMIAIAWGLAAEHHEYLGMALTTVLIAVCALAVANLLSRQRKTQQALEKSEQLFKSLFDNLQDGLLVADSESGKFLIANLKICDMLGYTHDELLQLGLADIHPADQMPRVMDTFRSMAKKELAWATDVVFQRKDGSTFFANVNSTTLEDAGRVLALGIFRDISDQKAAETRIRESEEKYRTLVETTDTGYVILDDAGRVVDANPEYVRLSGHAQLAEIVGRQPFEWSVERDRERNVEEVKKCLEQGFVRNLEIDYVDRQGKITTTEINAAVVNQGEGGRSWPCTAISVSARNWNGRNGRFRSRRSSRRVCSVWARWRQCLPTR